MSSLRSVTSPLKVFSVTVVRVSPSLPTTSTISTPAGRLGSSVTIVSCGITVSVTVTFSPSTPVPMRITSLTGGVVSVVVCTSMTLPLRVTVTVVVRSVPS